MSNASDLNPPSTTQAAGGDLPSDLPPVEPPTAGFIAQLFLIPALIVIVLAAVYLLFGKIAGGHRTPQEYLDDLRGANEERRWLAAHELAMFLQRDQKWQNDTELASDLAQELEKALADGLRDDRSVQYQKYLASALGAFNSETGIEALGRALARDVPAEVRLAAIWSFARLGDRLVSSGAGTHRTIANALPALEVAARDDDTEIRKLTAFALGCTGLPDATSVLMPLASDEDREVRYNAACSLARLGSEAGFDTIEEMLDMELLRRRLVDANLNSNQINAQLEAVPLAAIQSLVKYFEQSPGRGLGDLRHHIESLASHGPPLVRTRSKELLIRVESSRSM